MHVALGHAVADAIQQVAFARLAENRLWLDGEQRLHVDLAFVARTFLQGVIQLLVRAHAVFHHHLVDHALFLGAGVFVLQHRHQLVAFAVDLFQHHVAGHDHFFGVHAAVVGREGSTAHGHARLDVVGDDFHLAALVSDEVSHRHAGEFADGVVHQHVLARRHLAVEHVPAADHQPFGGAPVLVLLQERMPTYSQHDHIRAQVLDGGHVSGGAQAQVDLQSRQLQLVPAGDTGNLVTLRCLGGDGDLPANLVLLLEQGHVVATFGSHAGRFHAGRAGTYHHHFALHAGGFLDDVRHAHVFTGRCGVLDAQHVQALVLAVDAVVGADALLDLVNLAHLDLGDQVRVGHVRTGHADHVHVAAFKDACSLVRVLDVLRVQHRNLDHFLDAGRQVQERLRRVAHVGDDVGQGVVGVATRADHADEVEHAGGVVVRGDLLHVFMAEAIGVELVTADTHAHAEVVTDLGAYGLEHFQAKLHAAFEGAAPFVGTLVDPWAPELVDHVLVHGRQFHAVQAALFGATCRLRVVADDAPDLFHLDGFAGGTVHGFTDTRRRHQGRPVEAVPARATAHVGNLDHDLGAMLVHGVGQVLEVRDDAVGRQVDRRPPFLRAVDGHDGRAAADRQADAALGLFFVVLHVAVGRHAAVSGVDLGVRGAEHAVADGQFADLDRLEHCFECHDAISGLQRLCNEQAIFVAFFRPAVDLLGHGADLAAAGSENLVHGAGEPAGEHVVDLAAALAIHVHERRVLELDAAGAFVQVDVLDLEQAPATLAQALHVVLEHRHAFQAMALGFFFTPVPGGLVAGLVEDLGVGVGAQHFLDADVVVDEEMAWHVQHRQGVAGPDTGLAVDFDWQLRGDLGHGNSTP